MSLTCWASYTDSDKLAAIYFSSPFFLLPPLGHRRARNIYVWIHGGFSWMWLAASETMIAFLSVQSVSVWWITPSYYFSVAKVPVGIASTRLLVQLHQCNAMLLELWLCCARSAGKLLTRSRWWILYFLWRFIIFHCPPTATQITLWGHLDAYEMRSRGTSAKIVAIPVVCWQILLPGTKSWWLPCSNIIWPQAGWTTALGTLLHE